MYVSLFGFGGCITLFHCCIPVQDSQDNIASEKLSKGFVRGQRERKRLVERERERERKRAREVMTLFVDISLSTTLFLSLSRKSEFFSFRFFHYWCFKLSTQGKDLSR